MKFNFILTCLILFLSISLTHAQRNVSLVGNWELESSKVVDGMNEELKEQSFFKSYNDGNNILTLKTEECNIIQGGDLIKYTYIVKGNLLVLSGLNTVHVKNNGVEKEIQSVGTTEFTFKLRRNQLSLYRKSDNFIEKYVFKLIK